MPKSTVESRPRKPRPDFPLFPHATGRWAKKVRQKLVYFGKIADDPKGESALKLWLDQRDDLLAGRTPRRADGELTVKGAFDRFLHAKRQARDRGELSPRTWVAYQGTCVKIADTLGRSTPIAVIGPEEFARLRQRFVTGTDGRQLSATTLLTEIQRAKAFFSWCYKSLLIDKPVQYGLEFSPPSRRILERERIENGERFFSPDEIHWLLKKANHTMRAAILLGINAGYGPADLARVEFKHLDLEAGWATLYRRKTGERRRAKLWGETVEALRKAIAVRRPPVDQKDRSIVFLTRKGTSWLRENGRNALGHSFFQTILKKAPFHKPGHAFYSLRRSFRTVADEVLDGPAIDMVMGHRDNSMGAVYRQKIADERLERVAEHVRNWLYAGREGGGE